MCLEVKRVKTDFQTLQKYLITVLPIMKCISPNGAVTEIAVKNGMTDKIKTSANANQSILIKKGDKEKISADIVLPNEIEAPVEKNAVVGKIIYKNSGHQIAECPITAAESAEQIDFWKIFKMIFIELSGAFRSDL